eukprot:3894081-Amphidinium_carterae.1
MSGGLLYVYDAANDGLRMHPDNQKNIFRVRTAAAEEQLKEPVHTWDTRCNLQNGYMKDRKASSEFTLHTGTSHNAQELITKHQERTGSELAAKLLEAAATHHDFSSCVTYAILFCLNAALVRGPISALKSTHAQGCLIRKAKWRRRQS